MKASVYILRINMAATNNLSVISSLAWQKIADTEGKRHGLETTDIPALRECNAHLFKISYIRVIVVVRITGLL